MNYYNEFDPKAAAWLRALIEEKLIPVGEVDERSICDVRATDISGFVQCHFFAGIGGWARALNLAGWHKDRQVWTGSCPCQPFSVAGKGNAEKDSRHLWPVFRELIRQCRPATVFGEQVASALGRVWLSGVFLDLEGMAYRRAGSDLCSAGVNSPNIRQRLYWVADSKHAERRTFNEPGENGRDGQDSGREETHSQPGTCGEVFGVADSKHAERRGVQRSTEIVCTAQERASEEIAGRGEAGWMGEPIQQGLEGHAGNGDDRNEPGREPTEPIGSVAKTGNNGGFWSDAIWHPCTDGKHRRIPIEPSFFPLAARLPGRVAMLKGFGNAINPEIAAEFIKAYIEVKDLCS